MPQLQYDESGFALSSGMELCHCCDWATGAYIGQQEQYISIHCGLPAHAYIDAPPTYDDGECPYRRTKEEQWTILPDFRGKTVYNKITLASRKITTLGAIPEEDTLLAPNNYNDVWDNTTNSWVAYTKTKQEKLQELAEQYNTDLFSLQRAWLSAAVADGVNEGTRKEAIEAEIDELKAEYLENRATIEAEG